MRRYIVTLILLFGLFASTKASIQESVSNAEEEEGYYDEEYDDTNTIEEENSRIEIPEPQVSEPHVSEPQAPSRELHKKSKKQPAKQPPQIPIVVQIQRPVAPMQKKLSCPMGYSLSENSCVSNKLLSPEMRCPPGFTEHDGRCLNFARARMDCPPEYRLSGGRCTLVEIVTAQYTCPDGSLDETGKGCQIIEAVGPQCPPGYILDGAANTCTQKFSAPLRCQDGQTPDKHGCKKHVEFEPQIMCPRGSEMSPDGTTCYKTHHQKAKCPKGYTMGKDTGKCFKKVKKVLAPCQTGFTPLNDHNDFCERKIDMPPELSCPVDSHLDPSHGVCVSEMPSTTSCPDGFSQSISAPNMCEKIIGEVGTCPPGTTPIGYGSSLRCQSVIEHPMIQCCPVGYSEVFGKCEKRSLAAPLQSCDDCVRVKNHPVAYSCPEGYLPHGQRCIRRTSEPCIPEPQPKVTNCAPYQRFLGSGSLRSMTSAEASMIPPECLTLQPKLCQKDETIPAQISCPPGTEFTGSNCIERYEIASEPRCEAGSILDNQTGQCLKIKTAPMKTECMPGTTRVGNRCVQYEEHAPEFTCPPEATHDGVTGSCVIRSPSIVNPSDVFRSAPISICPSGTLGTTGCWDIERIPRSWVCPEGSVPGDKHSGAMSRLPLDGDSTHYCITYADLIIPPPTKKHLKPLYFCSDGKYAHGKKCHSHAYSPMISVCPVGTTLDESEHTCTRRVRPISGRPKITSTIAVPICPYGTTVQGTKCVSTKQVPPHILCSAGYQLSGISGNNRECAREVEKIAICPPGTSQTAEGCLRAITIAPIITEVSACEEEQCY